MKSHTARLYVTAVSLLVFFVLWATIAAHPWASPAKQALDPRLVQLTAREHRLQREALAVKRLVAQRWARYERQLIARRRAIAAAKQRHDAQVAAAQAAYRQIAAQQAAAAASYAPASYARSSAPASAPVAASAPAAAPAAAPAPRVVTLPPQVRTVTLPAVTSSGSSHP